MTHNANNQLELSDNISKEAQHDILELQSKISSFRLGLIDGEKFRSYRLARGIYGQRQEGVQMIRIKLPFGKVTPDQLLRIADISDEYASCNLHLTTRQDIQIHYVKLENAPKVWAQLEEFGITTREACGNTVRNITGSAMAGIDPKEPFDVSPYVYEHFRYFLRNPICQEMGRKFKISFSSSEDDTAFAFIHDIGFIPKVKTANGKEIRGFKVLLAGGLGAQEYHAHLAYEFLPEDQIIPFTEAVIRVFDRYGERTKRNKARLKYLVNNLGFEEFMKLVEIEKIAIKTKSYVVDRDILGEYQVPQEIFEKAIPVDQAAYNSFIKTNVFEQKQKGYYAVQLKVLLGDLPTDQVRKLANIVKKFASKDIRITVNQGLLLRFVRPDSLPALYNELFAIGLADPGFDSTADITACPGTDTCNLGIASSTGLAVELERLIHTEFPDLIFNNDIKIKISGCMNGCGQHSIASIGFHGMSIKKGNHVLPAMQLMLGGGIGYDGNGLIADKIIKVPSKRVPDVFRALMHDYEENAQENEYYNNYYRRMIADEKLYFFKLLKPITDLDSILDEDFIDWGHDAQYIKAIGVGECAGALVDLVAILVQDSEEKHIWSQTAMERGSYADAIYHGYNTFITSAKALLIGEGITCNTQIKILKDFDEHLNHKVNFAQEGSFEDTVLEINKNEPTQEFALLYTSKAGEFLKAAIAYRQEQLIQNTVA
jgi:sulfite reductase (ferredoxin)